MMVQLPTTGFGVQEKLASALKRIGLVLSSFIAASIMLLLVPSTAHAQTCAERETTLVQAAKAFHSCRVNSGDESCDAEKAKWLDSVAARDGQCDPAQDFHVEMHCGNLGSCNSVIHQLPPDIICIILHDCPSPNVVTQHNNNARTGAQLDETALTPSNVNPTHFGLLYDRHVLGAIMAQPLFVQGVQTPSGAKNLVFIATAEDMLYAFNADDFSPDATVDVASDDPGAPGGKAPESTKWIWRTRVGHPHVGDICGETDPPLVGVTSTPVIDVGQNVMYVVAREQGSGGGIGHDNLHAIDIRTGKDLRSVQVGGTDPLHGFVFNDQCERQRPGLLLQSGNVYLGYGTYTCDAGCPNNEPYRGWILGYQASNFAPAGVFTNSTSYDEGGMGVWASGNGLAGASDGSIYYQTGNDIDPALSALGDSFVKLNGSGASLTLSSHYQPADASAYRGGDTDLGAGGPMLVPGGKVIGGGKDGRLFVLSQTDLNASPQNFQAFYNSFHWGPGPYPYNSPMTYLTACPPPCLVSNVPGCVSQFGVADKTQPCSIDPSDYKWGESFGPNIHAGPVFWQNSATHGFVYKMSEKDYLKAFDYDIPSGTLSSTPAAVATVRPLQDGMPGGFSSVSANGTSNGIIWTVVQGLDSMFGYPNPATLYAHDATDLHELWNNGPDSVPLAKFNAPTVAAGKVFLPSMGLFQVYGELQVIRFPNIPVYCSITCLFPWPWLAIEREWSNLGGPEGLLGQATDKVHPDPEGGYSQDFATLVAGGGFGHVSVPPSVKIMPEMCERNMQFRTHDLRIESSIYASKATGAHFVRGEIRRVWLASGGLERFGYPLTNETATPDGLGLMTRFQRGTVYWYPGHNAQVGEPKGVGGIQER